MKSLPLRLQEHIDQSKKAVKANKAKGNRHGHILSVMYSDTSRFIDELIQNAEDALRRKEVVSQEERRVQFRLYNDRIEFHHKGIDFDVDDFISVTTFANSTKTGMDDVNLIGKFGIGFKSVFSVSELPEIHSGEMAFRIEDYELPIPLNENIRTQKGETLFVLPFKEGEEDRCFRELSKALKELKPEILLFLQRISSIEILIGNNNQPLTIENVEERRTGGLRKLKLFWGKQRLKSRNYLVFENAARTYGFAFFCSDDFKKVLPKSNTVIFNGLPAYQHSGLGFFINAPFTTSPTRELIFLNKAKTPENLDVLLRIERLLPDCLSALKRDKLLCPHMMLCFPLTDAINRFSEDDFKSSLSEKMNSVLTKYMRKGRSLMSENGAYVKATEAVFTDDDKLGELLGKSDLSKMFQKSHRLMLPVENDERNRIISFYENVLKITHINWEKLCFTINLYPEFLQSKTNKSLAEIYRAIAEHDFLWNELNASRYYSLRKTSFIRTKNHGIIPAFNNDGVSQVFLPGKISHSFPQLHPYFMRDEACINFFIRFGLRDATIKDVINGIADKWETEKRINHQLDEYIEDLLFVQKKISADKELFASVYEYLFQKLPLPLAGDECFKSISWFLSLNKGKPTLSSSFFNLSERDRKSLTSLINSLYVETDEAVVPPEIIIPEISFHDLTFSCFEESTLKNDHSIETKEQSFGEVKFPSGFLEVLSSGISKKPLKNKFLAFMEEYFLINNINYKKEKSGCWDFVICCDRKTESFVSIAYSEPLENNIEVAPAALKSSWVMYADGRGEDVVWYCIKWEKMQNPEIVIIANPVKYLLDGSLKFNMNIMLP